MGAVENDQPKDDSLRPFTPEVIEKLEDGWRISSLPDGQLLLLSPSTYGEPRQK